jgi:hypothetical protein
MPTSKVVAFGDVQVRKYPMVLGCHPGCTAGLPLELAWVPVSIDSSPVDVYEFLRRRERRRMKPRRLSQEYRREYLSSLGLYTNDEYIAVLMECLDIQQSRVLSAGSENSGFFLDDNFFHTSAAALLVGGTLKSVLKNTRALGDTSLSAALKGSQAAVSAAVTASKATGNAIGTSSKAIAKVSAGKAKTIVKAVSASAEKVRSHSVGRRRPSTGSCEFAKTDENDPEDAEKSEARQRPSLSRLFSSQECIDADGSGPSTRSVRSRARSRSKSRLLGTRNAPVVDESDENRVRRDFHPLKLVQRRSRSIGRRRGQSPHVRSKLRSQLVDDAMPKDSLGKASLAQVVSGRLLSEGTTDDESSEELNPCE